MITHIDTEALKRAHPIADVIGRYGIALRPSGRCLVGRCPFHADGGRPNLTIYPASDSFFCYRCGAGGDAITFVERIEAIGFRAAVARLTGSCPCPSDRSNLPVRVPRRQARGRPTGRVPWGAAERACLAAAVELYGNRLLADPAALAYVVGRGLDRATLERHRVGYASGDELTAYLRWRGLPVQGARRAGLLGRDGRELLAGRVVVPEIRAGRPVRLVGRAIAPDSGGQKYLGLPGRKPLLGWEAACRSRVVYLTEGPFDWLTLRRWGFPALALVGTRVRTEALRALDRFARIYLVLDGDSAGQQATEILQGALGRRAIPVRLPGVKDVAELGLRPDGRDAFARSVRQADLPAAA